MKKTLLIPAFAIIMAAAAFAGDYPEIPFRPVSPNVLARGGSFMADTHGYDSFFYNPAGYSRDPGAFTLVSAAAWALSRPDDLYGLGLQLLAGTLDSAAEIGFISKQVTAGGLGFGSSIGIGMAGGGLGLGAVLIVDSMLYGQTLLGASGDLTGTVGFIGGLASPIDLFGMRVHLGVNIRPMIRVHVPLSNANTLAAVTAFVSGADVVAALNSADALYGAGIGLDLGIIAELGGFSIGAAVRDIGGTSFRYSRESFGTVVSTVNSQMKLPTGSAVTTDTYTVPMDVSAGVAFHPDLGDFAYIFDPSISVDAQDILGVIRDGRSPWTLLRAGAEVRLLSLFTIGGGFSQGYVTLGGGVKLLFLEANFALFTQELGAHIGDRPSSGATLEVALRY